MNKKYAKINDKYQIVLPREIRKHFNLRPQGEVLIEYIENVIVIIPKPSSFTEMALSLEKDLWNGIDALEYITKEREQWEKRNSSLKSRKK